MKNVADFNKMLKAEIVEYINMLIERYGVDFKPIKVKTFNVKSAAIARALLVQEAVKEKKQVVNPVKEENGKINYKNYKSRSDCIRAIAQSRKQITQDELKKALEYLDRNAHILISIIGNPKRVKNPINFTYDRKTKTYTFN